MGGHPQSHSRRHLTSGPYPTPISPTVHSNSSRLLNEDEVDDQQNVSSYEKVDAETAEDPNNPLVPDETGEYRRIVPGRHPSEQRDKCRF